MWSYKLLKKTIFLIIICYAIFVIFSTLKRNNPTRNNIRTREEFVFTTRNERTSSEDALFKKLIRLNTQQRTYNFESFPTFRNEDVVIMVQANDRIFYLRHLIESLSMVSNISTALLIFSHCHYSIPINQLVASIKFCKTMQIFYPYSMQIYKDRFPGQSPDDCPRHLTWSEARKLGCSNADYPDSYGHYREANFSQIKLHWWWKAHMVFENLEVTKNFNGFVLFLEEDHYVAKDLLHVFSLMKGHLRSCDGCNILVLGNYESPYYSKNTIKQLRGITWRNTLNMGMAFNRSTWKDIKGCANYFCTYDDYNWDYSLMFTSKSCLDNNLYAMVIKQTRVFHMGSCGVHHMLECNDNTGFNMVVSLLEFAEKDLFPSRIEIGNLGKRKSVPINLVPNGGWSDPRDLKLCLNFSNY